MADMTAHVERAIRAAGVPVVSVSIGHPQNKGTWTVTPSSLQAQAQPVIDGFNPDDPAHALADADVAADAYYKDKDVLGMVAVILEKTDAAFATDTNATKRTKVVAAAVRFNQQRKWVERNFSFMTFPATP